MTAFALQVAAIGGQQVGAVALQVVLVVGASVALTWSAYHLGRWALDTLRGYQHRYERPAPVPGCPWCDDRGIASQCDCTGDCGRWCCMAGSGGALPRGHGDGPAIERRIDEMIERYGRG